MKETNNLSHPCDILPSAAADQRNINWRMYVMKSGRPSIDLAIRGRTYAERQQDLRDKLYSLTIGVKMARWEEV